MWGEGLCLLPAACLLAAPTLSQGRAGWWGLSAFNMLLPFATPFGEGLVSSTPLPTTVSFFPALQGAKGEPSHLSSAQQREPASSLRGWRQSKYFHLYFASLSFWQGVDFSEGPTLRERCHWGRHKFILQVLVLHLYSLWKAASKSGTFSLCSLMSTHSRIMILS